ncbi:MAG: adenylate/guanylate cyclase domain-containing protein [Candidatus Marinimicrobia bacterium]|nr:adenylate/guanylate cyclase domain-containing protein [Candidatus Neomarinimicrobiota bacterium]
MKDVKAMKEIATGDTQGTVLFIDIKNFLGISGILSPKETCQFIIQAIEPLSESIKDHNGYVCQIQGDAIMAVFVQMKAEGKHAIHAIECALELQMILDTLNPIHVGNIRVPLSARVGLCSGDLYSCYINVADRREFTILGKTVNLASRYQKLNKYYDTKILIDESVFAYIKNDIVTRKLDKVKIEGCNETIQIHEVLFSRTAKDKNSIREKADYEKGLAKYLQGDWDDAITCFSRVEEDRASYCMIKRCKERKAFFEFSRKYMNNKK